MKREARFQTAKHWIRKYEGKHIIKGYSKHFGVNKLCAIKELEMLRYNFKPEYIKQIKGRWATERLNEYMVKDFTMNDERLKEMKNLGQDYKDDFDIFVE